MLQYDGGVHKSYTVLCCALKSKEETLQKSGVQVSSALWKTTTTVDEPQGWVFPSTEYSESTGSLFPRIPDLKSIVRRTNGSTLNQF